jgi:streptogramin lyase
MGVTNKPACAISLSLSLILICGASPGQVTQAIPFKNTGDLLVIDASGNQVWRFMDLNLDGDWNDAGEIVSYHAFPAGSVLTNLAVGPDGAVYVTESANDSVWRLQDLNGDGVATSPGEATLFFSAAGNASGVTMPSPLGITVSADGAVWVANSNTSTQGTDSVIRLFDGNGDGNAQGAGEAVEYGRFAVGQSAGSSVPTNVTIGADGAVYYLETGTMGRGIYRLHDDVTPNGLCTDPGEVTAFYLPTSPTAPSFFGLASDRNGNFWAADQINDRILRVKDLNTDLTITNGGAEESVFFQAAAPSTMWNMAVSSGGAVYVVEDGGTSDRIFRLVDLNSDGNATGSGEMTVVYDDTIASVNLGSIRALAFLKAPFIKTTPNPIPIGTGVTFSGEAGAYDIFDVWASIYPDSFAVPPYGTVGISISIPGAYFELVPVFPLGPTGSFSFFTGIPNDPILLNATFYIQAIGGPPARLQLSNVAVVTFI